MINEEHHGRRLSSTINMQFAGRGGLFSPFGRDAEGREGMRLCLLSPHPIPPE